MGIAWIYKQLVALIKESHFNTETEYWINRSFESEEVDKGFAGFDISEENETKAFGLLEDIGGTGMLKLS